MLLDHNWYYTGELGALEVMWQFCVNLVCIIPDHVHHFWSHFRVLLTEKEHKNDSYQPKYFMIVCASLMKKFFQQNACIVAWS